MSPISSTLANASAYGYRSLSAAAGTAYESIASSTPTGGSTTVTFSSIPTTYTSLQIRMIVKNTGAGEVSVPTLTFNNDSGNNYSQHQLYGTGASAVATGDASFPYIGLGSLPASSTSNPNLTNIFGVSIIDIHDYNSTTRNKTVRFMSGCDMNYATTNARITLGSGAWLNTNAITSIKLSFDGTVSGTTISLYGIKGA